MTILVIGAGSIGKRHLKNLLSLGYRDVFVADSDNSKAKGIEKDFGIKFYGTPAFALEKERPDVTLICVPTHLHIFLADLALNYNSHIFIEKPISHNLKGIDALIEKADRIHRTVMVACNYRFHKVWLTLQKILKSERYGAPLLARVVSGYYLPSARTGVNFREVYSAKRMGGGVILDSGIHLIDYLCALFGDVSRGVCLKSSARFLDIDSEEAAYMLLEHSRGVMSSISLDYVSRKPIHRVEIVTEKGLILSDFKKDYVVFEDEAVRKTIHKGTGDVNSMFVNEIRHFFRCVKRGEKPLQDLRGGKLALEILLRIKRANVAKL